jgi:hypothetical protein
MSASGFRTARVTPIMGRALVDDDERPGASPVVVIAYEEWQGRFGGDARILDRTVRLDDTVHAIVGVMPPGFGFPVNYRYWVSTRIPTSQASRSRTDFPARKATRRSKSSLTPLPMGRRRSRCPRTR